MAMNSLHVFRHWWQYSSTDKGFSECLGAHAKCQKARRTANFCWRKFHDAALPACRVRIFMSSSTHHALSFGVTKLTMNETLFLHVGKSGGGTVKEVLRNSNVPYKRCHPRPCPDDVFDATTVLVTVRDHVDRFVSAFDWKGLILCKEENETRKVSSESAIQHPESYCMTNAPRQAEMIHEKYKSNANILAEALCESGERLEKARYDFGLIGHAKHLLSDWLPQDTWRTRNVFAIVQEPGFDLMEQTNAAIEWIVSQNGDTHVHSSNQSIPTGLQHSTTSNRVHSELSSLGTCCVARHLASDYDLLYNLSFTACKGKHSDICVNAITSILKRRATILNATMSCNELVNYKSTHPPLSVWWKRTDTSQEDHEHLFDQLTSLGLYWIVVQVAIVGLLLAVCRARKL